MFNVICPDDWEAFDMDFEDYQQFLKDASDDDKL